MDQGRYCCCTGCESPKPKSTAVDRIPPYSCSGQCRGFYPPTGICHSGHAVRELSDCHPQPSRTRTPRPSRTPTTSPSPVGGYCCCTGCVAPQPATTTLPRLGDCGLQCLTPPGECGEGHPVQAPSECTAPPTPTPSETPTPTPTPFECLAEYQYPCHNNAGCECRATSSGVECVISQILCTQGGYCDIGCPLGEVCVEDTGCLPEGRCWSLCPT